MPRKARYRAIAEIDPEALASFQAGIRKRYSDEQILAELRACAERLGRSPTMKEFAADPGAEGASADGDRALRHLERGQAGCRARAAAVRDARGAARPAADLGEELGRTPTARDIDERRGRLPSKSLYWHTFGSLASALREAGFDVVVGEERLERAVQQGVDLARSLGRLPKFADWAEARRRDPELLTEWQVYRMFDSRRGAWATFQFLVRGRLLEDGTAVGSDGSLA